MQLALLFLDPTSRCLYKQKRRRSVLLASYVENCVPKAHERDGPACELVGEVARLRRRRVDTSDELQVTVVRENDEPEITMEEVVKALGRNDDRIRLLLRDAPAELRLVVDTADKGERAMLLLVDRSIGLVGRHLGQHRAIEAVTGARTQIKTASSSGCAGRDSVLAGSKAPFVVVVPFVCVELHKGETGLLARSRNTASSSS